MRRNHVTLILILDWLKVYLEIFRHIKAQVPVEANEFRSQENNSNELAKLNHQHLMKCKQLKFVLINENHFFIVCFLNKLCHVNLSIELQGNVSLVVCKVAQAVNSSTSLTFSPFKHFHNYGNSLAHTRLASVQLKLFNFCNYKERDGKIVKRL